MGGISHLFFLRDLAKAVDERWPSVLADLEETRRILINRNSMLVNVSLDEAGWVRFKAQVEELLNALPAWPAKREPWTPGFAADHEGMTIPAQVNYVGKGVNLYGAGYRFHGSAHVISRHLRNAWLWEKVRVQGGAYGAFSAFDRLSGVLTFVSYRDPNLGKTLDVFDESARFLKNIELSEDELTKAVIGTIGDIDQYHLPDAKGFISLVRYLSGETDEDRQKMREEVLHASVADFRSFGRVLERVMPEGLVKVLGSEQAIETASSQEPGWLTIKKVL
jgi:Zn-dependent M16 (insulinase) family peptidase